MLSGMGATGSRQGVLSRSAPHLGRSGAPPRGCAPPPPPSTFRQLRRIPQQPAWLVAGASGGTGDSLGDPRSDPPGPDDAASAQPGSSPAAATHSESEAEGGVSPAIHEALQEVDLSMSPTYHSVIAILVDQYGWDADDPDLHDEAVFYLTVLLDGMDVEEGEVLDAGGASGEQLSAVRITSNVPSFMQHLEDAARSQQAFLMSEEDAARPGQFPEPDLTAPSTSGDEAFAEALAAGGDEAALRRLGELAQRTGVTDEELTNTNRTHTMAPETVSALIGLGTWRLNGLMQEPFEVLAAQVEGMWRQVFEGQLGSYPMARRWDMMDSLDPSPAQPDAESYLTIPDPVPGTPGYPRLLLENRCYAAPQFRKMHLELCARQDGLQVLHCVMFPKPEYDLPILGLDMVGSAQGMGFLILDVSPVTLDGALPHDLREGLLELQREFMRGAPPRLPAWSQGVFSDLCVAMRPSNPQDVDDFLLYAICAARLYMVVASHSTRVSDPGRVSEIKAAQQAYCIAQLQNSKTRAILSTAFGQDVAGSYMEEVMFDLSNGFEDRYPMEGEEDFTESGGGQDCADEPVASPQSSQVPP